MMIVMRHSPALQPNEQLRAVPAQPGESNRHWLARTGLREGIVLLGGNSVAHFRIRVAQSHLRHDLLPSYWSLVGILEREHTFASVPLEWGADVSAVPRTNGVQSCRLEEYDDPGRFPNIGVFSFTAQADPIHATIARIKAQRSIIDLPSLLLAWLGFVWSAGQAGNPLLAGRGLPSAAFVETVYGIAGIELTPGLSSASSCPEAIWQAAKWWHPFYEGTTGTADAAHAVATVPIGRYALRQPAAAVVE